MNVNRVYLIANIILIGGILSADWAFSKNKNNDEKILYHVLLLKWKSAGTSDSREELISIFQKFPAKVDGFQEVEILNLGPDSDEFDVAIIMSFSSSHGLEAYKVHDHRRKIKEMAPLLIEGSASYDF